MGSLVVQLLARQEVSVLGIASHAGAAWLTAHGPSLVEYGDGLHERLRAAAPLGIDAFIDLFGPEYVRLAVDLGVRHGGSRQPATHRVAQSTFDERPGKISVCSGVRFSGWRVLR